MRRWLAGLAALLLSGCGSPTEVPAGIPVDEDGDALPNLEGFVVDEAIRPMGGVTVRILFSDVNATTDDDGHYAIYRPTRVAEAVLLSAAAPGYRARTQQVQVSGYSSMRMDFRLEPDPYQIAHVEVLSQTMSLGCRFTSASLGPVVGGSCTSPSISGLTAKPRPVIWAIDTNIGLAGAVFELHWDPQTELTETLRVVLRGPVAGCCADGDTGTKGEVHGEVTGASPLRLELPEAAARSFPSWTALWLEVHLPDGQATAPLTFSVSQTVDAYATIFYVDPAPPGYTLA